MRRLPPGQSRIGTIPLRTAQRGYLLVTVIFTLFLLATVSVLLTQGSAINANTAGTELEAARVNYVTEAGMQHALWKTQNNACMGDITIPDTTIGPDTYAATVTGAAAGTAYTLSPDQDAWIRNDDVTKNNGKTADQHIKFEAGKVEHALTRFDLSTLPKDAQITSATAWFYITPSGPGGGAHPEGQITVHPVTADWTETGATWDTLGGKFESSRLATIPAQAADSVWISFNLTGQVQAWVNGQPNFGILMASEFEGVHGRYSSREDGGNAPRLDVVVGSGAASPVTIKATGKLDSGVNRTSKDTFAVAYQPPTTMSLPLGTDGKDGWVDSSQIANNYGVAGEMTISGGANPKHFLAQFAAESIPSGSRIASARLEMYLNYMGSADPAGEFSVYAMSEPWTEGSGDNWNPGDGANWATSDGSNAWSWTSNHDASSPVATTQVDPSYSGWHSWDVSNLVKQWSSGERPNYGLLVKGNDNARDAWFRSSDWADSTQHPRLVVEFACECGSPCMAPQGTGRIALIGDDNSPDPYDQLKIQIIESWGYQVDFYQDRDSDTINWNDYDLAYVSETVIRGDISANLTDLSIGVVNEEPRLYADLQLASGYTEHVGSSINIIDSSHFITAIFPQGPLSIYTGDMEILTADAPLAGGLRTLGQFSGAASLAALDLGAQTTSGTAAARRVTLPLGQHFAAGFDWTNLGNNGQLLVQRAIAWGMNTKNSLRILLVVGISTALSTRDTARRDLFGSWGHNVTIIDDEATLGEFDAATALHDVVYVGGTVVTGRLADKLTESTLGIVSEVAGHLDEFGFGSNVPTTTATNNMFTATDALHYISEPFAGASVTHFTPNLAMPVASGTLAPNLGTVASLGTLTWAIPVLDTGTQRWDSDLSAGRRVNLPFGNAEISQVTPDGLTLMRRSIEWAGGAGTASASLSGHWKLDDATGLTATDSSGQGNDGTLAGGPDWTSGQLAGALALDDLTSDRVVVPDDPSLDITGAITLAAWIKPNELGSNYIISKYEKDVTDGYELSLSSVGKIFFRLNQASQANTYRVQSTLLYPTDGSTWMHIAATYDGETQRLYINGVEENSQPASITINTNDIDLGLGGQADGTRVLDGVLDDVRIYGGALDAAAIAELATLPGPIAHWKLDDGTGSAAVDSIGNNDGTLVDNPAWVAGKIGDALDFDGVNDYVNAGTFDVVGNGLTMMGWFNAETISTLDGRIVSKANGGNDFNAWWQLSTTDAGSNRYLRMRVKAGGTTTELANYSVNLTTGQWYFAVATYDNASGDMKLYLNGAEIESGSHAVGGPVDVDAAVPVAIGANGPADRFFDGKLDDVRVYDRSLGAAEIADLYAEGTGETTVSHWKLDDGVGLDAVDSVGNNDGTLQSNPAWVAGKLGDALDFDGVNDYVAVGTFDVIGAGLTMMGWFNAETISTLDGRIVSKADGGNDFNAWWQLSTTDSGSNRYLRMRVKAGGTTTTLADSSVNLQTAQWYFAVATYDNSGVMKLYLDGVEVASRTHAVGGPVDTGPAVPVAIGANGTADRYFDGILDDVRVYDRALNATEIADLFTAGGGGGGGGGSPTTCIFRDDFENQSYGNQDGDALWAGDWQEVNDGGSPTGGDIRTEGGGDPGMSLRIQDDDRAITRAADLSGHSTATLTLDYKRVGLESGEYVAVSVYNGSTWTELAQFGNPPVGNDSNYQPYSEDISGFISPNFQIRLASPDGGMGNADDVKFDNLQIEATGGTTCP